MRIRNNKVNVFLSDDEKFILKRASSKLNLSQSEYIRMVLCQKESTLTVKEFCRQNNICVSSFYKSKRRLENDELQSDLFVPVEVADDAHPNVSMTIDGHCIEFDPALLDRIIGALK